MFIPDITSNLDFQTGAASDSYFINNGIDSLDDTTDVNIVLIHTHGGVSGSSCRLQFKDGSLLTASDVSNWLDQRDGGFFFAGACSSAKYTDLGYAFIYKGFDSYFGYRGTVNTMRNARFYAAFFEHASLADVEVCDAADYAEDQVFLDFGYADDVGDNTFFGDSNVCLNS